MTKDEALKLARDYIYNVDYGPYDEAPVLAAIDEALAQPAQELDEAAIRADEREACAKICDDVRHPWGYSCETSDWIHGADTCAAAIRARGQA